MNGQPTSLPTSLLILLAAIFFFVGIWIIKNPKRIQEWELRQYGDELLQNWKKEEIYIPLLRFFGFVMLFFGLMCVSMAINNVRNSEPSSGRGLWR